jgi:hypothetical protein
MIVRRTSRRRGVGQFSFDDPITSVTIGGTTLPGTSSLASAAANNTILSSAIPDPSWLQGLLDPFGSLTSVPNIVGNTSSGSASGGGDYCIELSDGSSTCFSLWIVALVAGVGIFALAMMSGGGRRR